MGNIRVKGVLILYNILVVDDEKIERDTIKFLINKYKFNLNVFEAENGEKAFEYIQNNQVDILFTDIKMPFMNGIQLCEKVLKSNPEIKIIFFSAYGEFEYAKKAITLGVTDYILKPLDVIEFQAVIAKVIKKCLDNENKKKRDQTLINSVYKGILYDKENLLYDIINGVIIRDDQQNNGIITDISFLNEYSRMILIEFKNKFFETNNLEFIALLKEVLRCDLDYLNLNQYQSVIFLKKYNKTLSDMEKVGDDLKQLIFSHYSCSVVLVFSKHLNNPDEIGYEYNNMEQVLEYKFFSEDISVFFADKIYFDKEQANTSIKSLIKNIDEYIIKNDYCSVGKCIELLNSNIKIQKDISPSFVKFTYSEILKKLYESRPKYDEKLLTSEIQKIYSSYIITDILNIIEDKVIKLKSNNLSGVQHSTKRAIEEVINLIHNDYISDLSVDALAEKVYFTPNYLSYVFKKQIGVGIVKYVTSYRLQKAKELLETTNMKIVDICKTIGYSNESYFSANFKNHFGVSPSKYRE